MRYLLYQLGQNFFHQPYFLTKYMDLSLLDHWCGPSSEGLPFSPHPPHLCNNNKQKETKTNQKGPTKNTPYFWVEGSFLDNSSSNFQAKSKLSKRNAHPLFLEKQHPNQKAGNNHLFIPKYQKIYLSFHLFRRCIGNIIVKRILTRAVLDRILFKAGRLCFESVCSYFSPFSSHQGKKRSTSFSSSGLQKTATFFWIPRPLGTVTLVLKRVEGFVSCRPMGVLNKLDPTWRIWWKKSG